MKLSEVKAELQLYSEKFYAKSLEEAGFMNYRNDLLNWYKLYNGVICHFHLLATDCRYPNLILVWMFHPSYIPEILNIPASWRSFDAPYHWWRYGTTVYFRYYNYYMPGCGINAPDSLQLGAERLHEQLFPQIQQFDSREAVYLYHKDEIYSLPGYDQISLDFVDEAIMMNDTEMYPRCVRLLEEQTIPHIRYCLEHNKSFSLSFVYEHTVEHLEAQLKALKGIEIKSYYAIMEERKAQFFKRYKLNQETVL